MADFLPVVAVFATLVLLVEQLRRLIAFTILNRTIRRALDSNSDQLPRLIDRLEKKSPLTGSALGVALILLSLFVAAISWLDDPAERPAYLLIASIPFAFGAALLGTAWWAVRSGKGDSASSAGSPA